VFANGGDSSRVRVLNPATSSARTAVVWGSSPLLRVVTRCRRVHRAWWGNTTTGSGALATTLAARAFDGVLRHLNDLSPTALLAISPLRQGGVH